MNARKERCAVIEKYIRKSDCAVVDVVYYNGDNHAAIKELVGDNDWVLRWFTADEYIGRYIIRESRSDEVVWYSCGLADFGKEYEEYVEPVEKTELTADAYQKEALRTVPGMSKPRCSLLLNGLMGLNGEAGECIDILKKHYFQGHELDKEHLAKELGDVAWYLAVSANALGYNLSTILQMNIDKLRARYPDGFDSDHSLNRRKDDI